MPAAGRSPDVSRHSQGSTGAAQHGVASHGDDMLGVGATPGVEPEREVTVIHDDDSDDGGGGAVAAGGPGAAGGEALADLEEELFGNIDDL